MARAAQAPSAERSSKESVPDPPEEPTVKRYINVDYKPHPTASGAQIDSGQEFDLPEADVAPEDQRLIDNGTFVLVNLEDDQTTTEGDGE